MPSDLEVKKFFQFLALEEDINQKLIPAIQSILGTSGLHVSEVAVDQRGDDDADGTSVLTHTVGAGEVFICTEFMGSCNVAGMLKVGTGDLSDPPTLYDLIDIPNRGNHGKMADGLGDPLFIIDNSSGTTAVTVRVWAPDTAYAVDANDNTHYYSAKLGGLEYKAP